MGTLSKKLYIKKPGGTAVACNIYDSLDAAGGKALRVMVDGITGYVALKIVGDSDTTNGRVKINGETYAIATQYYSGSTVPYAEKYWDTAGTYEFTVPSGVTRVRVAVCGGGGSDGGFSAGKSGGNSSAFDIVAEGGHGGSAWSYGAGGTPNGHKSSGRSNTDGYLMSFDKTVGTYGKGGKYSGGGGYDSQYVTVTSGQTYTITVGAAGGSSGTGGFVLIGYGGDI